MNRKLAFAYGVACYATFFGTFLYAIGFLGNFLVPRSIDSAPTAPWTQALLIDSLLLGLFAIQHSVMARPGFKNWWTKFVPEPIERSTYVLFSSLALILTFAFWQPLGGTVWSVEDSAGRFGLYSLYGMGWLIVLLSSFLINHFDLFGLRQVWLYLKGKDYTPLPFKTPGAYKVVRHPLYVGWFICFWATPTMTVSHLVFALLSSGYILAALPFEERDLKHALGEPYRRYSESVPRFIPRFRGAAKTHARSESPAG
jgi:protein-S-isoprenylcysteine O-methyltransferase Ste14